MTRVYIDISVFTPTSSVGVVNGHLVLDVVPIEGGSVAFDQPINPVDRRGVLNFTPRLEVEHVSPPVAGTEEPLLSLADITVPTRADALRVVEYLKKGFDLNFDEHETP